MQNQKSSNYKKYNTTNPVKKYLIDNFKNRLVSLLELSDNTKICELGCGEGFIIKEILQKNNNVVIEGYDIEKAAIEIAREINPSAYFDVLDVTNIPIELKNKKFDYVLLLEVLEHINDYETVLENLKEMNFKKLIISVPNEPLFSYGNLIFGKNVNRLGKDIEHVNFWNSKSFETLLSKYFNVSSISKPFPWLIAECENKE